MELTLPLPAVAATSSSSGSANSHARSDRAVASASMLWPAGAVTSSQTVSVSDTCVVRLSERHAH
eukprot:scaffold855_cov344-Prasinococcus_capsulatus_cf.AAC.10